MYPILPVSYTHLDVYKRQKLIKPVLGPDEGACLLAYKLAGNTVTEDFIENLSKSIEDVTA